MPGAPCQTQLAKLAEEMAFKLKRAQEYRASAASLLVECRRRVDAGDPEAQGVNWADYCRIHLPKYSPGELHKLILSGSEVGQSADEETGAQDAFDRAWAAFLALDRKRQSELLRSEAAFLVRSEGTAAPAQSGRTSRVDHLA